MTANAKIYIGAVIAIACVILISALPAISLPGWAFWASIAVGICGSALKLRLPGLQGTYALGYLGVVYGFGHLPMSQTLIVAAVAGLAQSYLGARKRPTIVQAVFNAANLVVSVWLSQMTSTLLRQAGIDPSLPSAGALLFAFYFAANTTIVSGVLALLQGKKLTDVCSTWYEWSLLYYMTGASLVATLFPASGPVRWEGALITASLLVLVQFYVASREVKRSSEYSEHGSLSLTATLMLVATCCAAAGVAVYAFLQKPSIHTDVFLPWLLATGVVSTWKVRLPGVQGSISLGFVLLLAGLATLSLFEVTTLALVAGVAQLFWRPARKNSSAQIAFSISALIVSAGAAAAVLSGLFGDVHRAPVTGLVCVAAIVLYSVNTWLVTIMVALVHAGNPGSIWLKCQFWTFAYYVVGACAAALMTSSSRMTGGDLGLLIIPVTYLIWLSYRSQMGRPVPMANTTQDGGSRA